MTSKEELQRTWGKLLKAAEKEPEVEEERGDDSCHESYDHTDVFKKEAKYHFDALAAISKKYKTPFFVLMAIKSEHDPDDGDRQHGILTVSTALQYKERRADIINELAGIVTGKQVAVDKMEYDLMKLALDGKAVELNIDDLPDAFKKEILGE